ncbi:hypothetical protein DPMN_157415 [Dreissena polymorpha]|uniref:Uncharacterized protein n=1 Tax=Dreissena polymorpha TaxID=45954 RepID=A0A9D4EH40_DREPO|nr:hypothetical protein DPMN_157415 [Dreissena polymorpha]
MEKLLQQLVEAALTTPTAPTARQKGKARNTETHKKITKKRAAIISIGSPPRDQPAIGSDNPTTTRQLVATIGPDATTLGLRDANAIIGPDATTPGLRDASATIGTDATTPGLRDANATIGTDAHNTGIMRRKSHHRTRCRNNRTEF